MKILFVCSKNQWRSPTAEAIWRKNPHFQVRSAGTSDKARRRVQAGDIAWADVIFVMESKHKAQLIRKFGHDARAAEIVVLDIPDLYPFMDEEGVGDYLG